MKLHLGCGQRYFEGYINIDYPLSEHSVQQKSVADQHANLLELKYARNSVDEVRLHHVFEHFNRSQAAALLASWNSWMKDGGTLHIEVPDFRRTAMAVLNPFSSLQAKYVGLRHIFGSQEAHWAVHFDGYTVKTLKTLMRKFGFAPYKVIKTKYRGIYNIEVLAKKNADVTREQAIATMKEHFKLSMVADVESERILHETWMNDFSEQLNKTFTDK